jgi:hypothetical protein
MKFNIYLWTIKYVGLQFASGGIEQMKKLFFILLLPLILLTQSAAIKMDQSEEAGARIKAIYIYNFTKYIEWPNDYKEGNFVIGVLGTNAPLLSELNKMASSKTVGNQKLEIKSITNLADAAQCHIIYILTDNSNQIADVINKIKGRSTLIVTDKAGMAKQGAGINFSIVENKQKIELNKANIEKYKLKIASTLVEMAVQVK